MAKKSHNNSSTQPQSAMAALLAKHTKDIVGLKKGETVTGKITKLTPGEVLVEVGAKTEALVLEKDKTLLKNLLATCKVGDKVTVTVLNPESEYGNPVVSLRRFLGDMAWEKLEQYEKSKDEITGTVQEVTKAGYLVATTFGISGFLPQSHTLSGEIHVGQILTVTVLELNRKDNKIIFSQKPTLSAADFAKAMKGLKEGDNVSATITNISSFGLFATIMVKNPSTGSGQALEAFIHISEISWEKVTDLASMFTVGQTVDAVIVRFDKETQRVNLSIKRLSIDPFEQVIESYPLEKKVTGTITAIDDSGITVAVDDEVEGFIKQEKIPPTTKYSVGQEVTVTVSEHDKKRHKLIFVPVLREKPLGYR